MDKVIDCKTFAQNVKEQIVKKVKNLQTKPHLAVILVGDNPASIIYIKNKQKACDEVGIKFSLYHLPNNTQEQDLLKIINDLNNLAGLHGILVQLPLPAHIDQVNIINNISPNKDVDCLHSINLGKILQGQENGLLPCTAYAVCSILEKEKISLIGKQVVIINDTILLGKPLSAMLLNRKATVVVCNKHTENIKELTNSADIVVPAVGIPGFLTEDMVKPGSVVIDVGISNLNGAVMGDAHSSIAKKVKKMTPVPNGVGKLTITTLLDNVLKATKLC